MAKTINSVTATTYAVEPVHGKGGNISGKQSNHGDFHLPACLAHLIDPPLYMAVAWWGLLSRQGVTRDDISQAFHIPQRRAADVLSYISRERSDVITCQRRVMRDGGRRHLVLTILAVGELAPVAPSPPLRVKKTHSRGDNDAVRQWRRWFLSRPNVSSNE